MKIIEEIKKVGLRDWIWFVIFLRRNEFHKSLKNLGLPGTKRYKEIVEKRRKAHRIDEKLTG